MSKPSIKSRENTKEFDPDTNSTPEEKIKKAVMQQADWFTPDSALTDNAQSLSPRGLVAVWLRR